VRTTRYPKQRVALAGLVLVASRWIFGSLSVTVEGQEQYSDGRPTISSSRKVSGSFDMSVTNEASAAPFMVK